MLEKQKVSVLGRIMWISTPAAGVLQIMDMKWKRLV